MGPSLAESGPVLDWARRSLPSLVLAAALLCPSTATAIMGDSEGPFGLDGSLRTFVFGLFKNDLTFTDADDEDRVDGLTNALVRLVAAGRPSDASKYELHLVSSSVLQAASGGGGVALFGAEGSDALRLRHRLLDDRQVFSDEPDFRSSLGLERLNLSLYTAFADVVIGRQAISFGKAYLWNPLDVFRPFDPTSFDRDYKTGVDALSVEIPVGETGSVTLVGALSHEDANEGHGRWFGASALARLGLTLGAWDVAVQGGKIYGGFQAGGAASGEWGPLAVRLEGAHFEPLDADDFERHQSVVLGVGHTFESGLQVEFEYFYNGGAKALKDEVVAAFLGGAGQAALAEAARDPEAFCAENGDLIPAGLDCVALVSDPATLGLVEAGLSEAVAELDDDQTARLGGFLRGVLNGRLYHTSEHLAGLVIRHELLPILHGTLATMVALDDGSMIIQPGLVYSAADEVDVVLGALVSVGEQPAGEPSFCRALGGCPASEFGTFPKVVYVESKIYF